MAGDADAIRFPAHPPTHAAHRLGARKGMSSLQPPQPRGLMADTRMMYWVPGWGSFTNVKRSCGQAGRRVRRRVDGGEPQPGGGWRMGESSYRWVGGHAHRQPGLLANAVQGSLAAEASSLEAAPSRQPTHLAVDQGIAAAKGGERGGVGCADSSVGVGKGSHRPGLQLVPRDGCMAGGGEEEGR